MYTVFVFVNDENCIVAVNSSAYLTDTTNWIEIDSGSGDRYYHAQGNYFPRPITDERGIYRYKANSIGDVPEGRAVICTFDLEGESFVVYERTDAEMDADYKLPTETPDMLEERVVALEAAMMAIEEGIASV